MTPDETFKLVKPYNDIARNAESDARLSELEHEVVRLQHKVVRLQQEVDLWSGRCAAAEEREALWRDRCVAEQEAHEASVKWFNEQMRRDEP